MKLALLADIHANPGALRACLDHARQAGATRFAVLGDLVGYGAEPGAVLDAVMALAEAGAAVLRGNHDAAALAPATQDATGESATAAWTRAQLTPSQQAFLAALPLTATVGDTLLVHASAEAPGQWHYVDDAMRAQRCLDTAALDGGPRRVLCGHVHHQRLFYRGRGGGMMAFMPMPGVPIPLAAHRGWVATVGSVGQPRDGDTRAMYALLDAAQSTLAFHRVPYDHGAAAAAIRRAGLPEAFAARLERGR